MRLKSFMSLRTIQVNLFPLFLFCFWCRVFQRVYVVATRLLIQNAQYFVCDAVELIDHKALREERESLLFQSDYMRGDDADRRKLMAKYGVKAVPGDF